MVPAQGALTYRPDIDGLRAIAVVAVVLFHAGTPGFTGGYVGVDVFYVISGYLITQLLVDSTDRRPRLRLTDFYIRRARRILPALFTMVLIVVPAAAAILLPWDLARFGNYLAATSVLGINIAAWLEGVSYFQSRAANVPIAHLWSIAIEEQFYLTYPLGLILIHRFAPRRRTAVLAALAAASFAVCVWGSYHAPAANFFLAPSRGWELLLGGILAATRRQIRSRPVNELLAVCGILILAFAVYRYQSTTPYPGLYALAPCAASAMIIASGRQQSTLAGRLLSRGPLVFTGLISYSIYLWHYPLLVLFGYYNIVPIDAFRLSLSLAVIYLMAALSWKFIETPLRARMVLKSNRSFLLSALIVNAIILATGVVLWKSDGLPRRFPPEIRARGGESPFDSDYLTACSNLPLESIASGDLCSVGPEDPGALRAVLWGDSHAMALLPAYQELASSHHVRLYFAIRSSCRPLVGFSNRSLIQSLRLHCEQFNDAVAQAVRRLDPSLLILNAHWVDEDADLIGRSNADAVPGESNFSRGLRRTLREAGSTRRTVCAVMDVPTLKYNLPNALGVARKRGIVEDFLRLPRAEAFAQYPGPQRDIRALERRGMLRSVDPREKLCSADSCTLESGGKLLYWDENHLSAAGAQFVVSALDGCFRGIGDAGSG